MFTFICIYSVWPGSFSNWVVSTNVERERDGKEELDRLQPREEEAVWIICCVKNDSFVTGNGLFLLHSTLDFRRVFDRHEMCQNEKNLSRL